jgi:hypothetical protein
MTDSWNRVSRSKQWRRNVAAVLWFVTSFGFFVASASLFNLSMETSLSSRKTLYRSVIESVFDPMNAMSYNSILSALFAACAVVSLIGMVLGPVVVSRYYRTPDE